jgi:hypothetical protein
MNLGSKLEYLGQIDSPVTNLVADSSEEISLHENTESTIKNIAFDTTKASYDSVH